MKHFFMIALVLTIIACALSGCRSKTDTTDMMDDAVSTISEGLGDTTAPTTKTTTAATEESSDAFGNSDTTEENSAQENTNSRSRRGMNIR